MRGVERIFGIARQTLARWILGEAAQLPDWADTLEDARPDDVLELEELWSFVLRKSNQQWIWIALCRRTRQVVAHYIGDRSEKGCRKLWERIPDEYQQCCSYGDFWQAYQKVFPGQTH
jgi:insertion element IS1 protein InsB